eukprot:gene41535-55063_t
MRVTFKLPKVMFKAAPVLKAVDGVSVAVRRGGTLGIVGESGSGKSTLGRALLRLLPSEGSVIFDGQAISKLSASALRPLRRGMQVVFQDPFGSLSPRMTVGDVITEGLLVHEPHLSRQQRESRAAEAMREMNRQGLYRLLADLRRELSVPIVLVTHDLNEARMLADRLVVMDAGQVLQQGSPASIHNAPRNARVADLVGIQNRYRGQWLGAIDDAAGYGRLLWMGADETTQAQILTVRDKGKIPSGQAVHWIIPSDGITLVDPSAPRLADGSDWDAQLLEARHLGEISLITLALGAVSG